MKALITSNATSTLGIPIQSKTLGFLEDSRKELVLALAKGIIGVDYNVSNAYVLHGCVNTGSGANFIISAGVILYNGEIFLVPAATFTTSGADVAVVSNVTTYLSGVDPVTFIGGTSSYNIHSDKTYVIAAASSGSGVVNYSDLVFVTAQQTLTAAANYTATGTKCRRNRDGLVTLSGSILCGAAAVWGQTITTLPAGYRPASTISQHCILSTGGAPYHIMATMVITTGGVVYISSTSLAPSTALNGYTMLFESITPFYNN